MNIRDLQIIGKMENKMEMQQKQIDILTIALYHLENKFEEFKAEVKGKKAAKKLTYLDNRNRLDDRHNSDKQYYLDVVAKLAKMKKKIDEN